MTRPYNDVFDFLKAKFTAVVATVSADGKPQAATVLFWLGHDRDRGMEVFFLTRRHTHKAQNLKANGKVALVVGTELEPYAVQVEGVADVVEEGDSLTSLWNMALLSGANPKMQRMFSGEYFPAAPFRGLEGHDFVVFRVRPTLVRYMSLDAKGEVTYTEHSAGA